MKKSFLLFCLFIIKFYNVQSQVTPAWVNVLGASGDNSDRYYSITEDGSGNIYAVGYTYNVNKDKDILIAKLNSTGDTVWTRQFNNALVNGSDKALFIGLDAANNIYLSGIADGGSIKNNDIIIQKYTNSGSLLWTTFYNYSPYNQDDEPIDMFVNSGGDVFITGKSDADSSSATNNDAITIKYNTNGVQQWVSRFNGSGGDADRGIAITGDNSGGCIITGRTFNATNDDVLTIKYSSTGAVSWQQIYNRGLGNDRGDDVFLDASGNIYVTGRSQNANDYDVVTIKYNSFGVPQWTQFYTNVENDYGNTVKVDASGNVYVGGQSDINASTTVANYDALTIKYNSSGVQQWAKLLGNAALKEENISKLEVDASGNVYVSGRSNVNTLDTVVANNFLTIKYNTSGVQQWVNYLNGTATKSDDQVSDMYYNSTTGEIVVAGVSQNLITQKDATIIKYLSVTGATVWTKFLNLKGDFSDKVNAIITDSKKNIYITGYVVNPEMRRDLFCAKFNTAGVLKWLKSYDFAMDDDEGKSIAIDTLGNVFVCGSSNGNGTGNDYIVIKYDTLGVQQWTYRYNYANESDVAVSIVALPNGISYVTGYSDRDSSNYVSNFDYVTIKLSATGNQSALVRYNGAANGADRPIKVFNVGASSLWVTGRVWNGTNEDIVTIKYNGSLTQLWLSTYAGISGLTDQPRDLFVDASGNSYLAGNTLTAVNSDDYVLVKYNNNGVQQWIYTYNGIANAVDRAYGVTVNNNGVFLTGRSSGSVGADSADIVTVKINTGTGAQTWLNRWNGAGSLFDRGNAIASDQIGNIYVTGETFSVTGGDDFTTVKYDDTGNVIWHNEYNGSGNNEDASKAIIVDAGGNIISAGYSSSSGLSGYEGTVIKFCPSISNPIFNNGSAVVCRNQTGVVFSVIPVVGASSYTWSASAGATISTGQGTNSVTVNFSSTASSSGISVIANGICSTSNPVVYSYSVATTAPATPGTISGSSTNCANSTAVFSIAPVANSTSYLWTQPSNSSILSGQGTTSITVSFSSGWNSGNLSVKAINCFGNSPNKSKALKSKPSTPGTITGNTIGVCPGTSGVVYIVTPVSGANTYTWTPPSNSTIISGQGTNSITVNYSALFSNGTLSVTAGNGCGTSNPKTTSIYSVPPAAATISGLSFNVCNAGTQIYSIAPITGATSYTWTVPSGVILLSGQNTVSITVSYPTNFISGAISVFASNTCGSGTVKTLNCFAKPETPGAITGLSSVCANELSVPYSITPISGATNYAWNVPQGSTIVSGQGTNSIIINFGSNAGNVSVYASNSCANSTIKSLAVSITCRSEDFTDNKIELFPNPASENINIVFINGNLEAGRLKIYNSIGQLMLNEEILMTSGQNEKAVDVSMFAKGGYLLFIENSEEVTSKKFVIR